MSKRFTDTNKYKKPFIRGLDGPYKLLWDYLYHDCDHAGIWIVDFDIARIYLGKDMPVDKVEALKFFNKGEDRIIEFSKGAKWFIVPFISFQYGELSDTNRVHHSVIMLLKENNLLKHVKPLKRPLQGCKDKDKDKEKAKDKDKEWKFPKELYDPKFQQAWTRWVKYRIEKRQRLTPSTIDLQLKKLAKLPLQDAIAMINNTIEKGWIGLRPPEKKNGKNAINNRDFTGQTSQYGQAV